jgi:hypothetical protein
MSEPEKKPLQVCQIQIQPWEDGYTIQAVNLDGAGRNTRRVATSIPELREKLKQIVETVYEPLPEKAPPTAEPKPAPGGPTGTQSPS